MDAIYSLIVLSMSATQVQIEIKQAMLTHFQGFQSVCIITDDFQPWINSQLPFTLVLWKDWTTRQDNLVEGYVIDIRRQNSWTAMNLTALRRINWTKFIIITSLTDPEGLSKSVMKFGICNILIIKDTAEGIEIYKHNDYCSGPGQEIIEDKNQTDCLINMSFMDLPTGNLFEDGVMGGWEGSQVTTIADHFKMKVNWTNRHESMWQELLDDAAEGRALGCMGAVYAFHWRWVRAELVSTCTPVTMGFAAPIHAGPSTSTWAIILVSELSPTVWTCTFLIYITLVLLAGLFKENPDDNDNVYNPFHIIALVLGISQNLILTRGFTLTVIFFGFMITIYYQAVMSSKLTAPAPPAEIRTWEQMLATNWSIRGNFPMQKMLRSVADAYPENPTKQEFSRRYVPEPKTIHEMLLRVVEEKNLFYGRHVTNIIYLMQQDPRLTGKLHIVEEPVITFYPQMMMPKHHCLTETFQHMFERVCATGLAVKWYNDLTAVTPAPEDNSPTKLQISHIKGFLFLLFFGWLASFVAFLIEVNVVWFKGAWKRLKSKFQKKEHFVVRRADVNFIRVKPKF